VRRAIARGEAKIKSGKRIKYGDPDVIAVLKRDERVARLAAAAEACKECKGKAVIIVEGKCPDCEGTGERSYEEKCDCQEIE
jgi:RecJ-like exonuclease